MPVQAGLLGNPLSRLVRKPLLTVGGSVYSARSSARKQSFLRCSRRVPAASCSLARLHRFEGVPLLSAAQNLRCAGSPRLWPRNCGVVLGAEIQWTSGKPDPVRATISWPTMKASKKPWTDRTLVAWDALPGWQFRGGSGQALFTSDSRRGLRLSPGAKVDIGWLRYDQTPALKTQVSEKTPATQ